MNKFLTKIAMNRFENFVMNKAHTLSGADFVAKYGTKGALLHSAGKAAEKSKAMMPAGSKSVGHDFYGAARDLALRESRKLPIEKVALNRYEKHLTEGGSTGGDPHLEKARARLQGAAKVRELSNRFDMPHGFKQMGENAARSTIQAHRADSGNKFSKDGDPLAQGASRYKHVDLGGGKSKLSNIVSGNTMGKSTSTFEEAVKKIHSAKAETMAKPTILSRAKSLLGSKAGKTGLVGLGVGAAAGLGAAALMKKDKKEPAHA